MNHQLALEMSGLIESFQGQAAGKRAVADDCYHAVVSLFDVARDCDSESRRNGRRGMPGVEDVVLRLSRLQKPEMPPCMRMVSNVSRRPVISLCG